MVNDYVSYYNAVMSNPLPNASEMRRLRQKWDNLKESERKFMEKTEFNLWQKT